MQNFSYMAEHLTPTGRAGIIVPEGIIFQSQTAHKQLRKMLVENYLVAVISLPAGVFQPYSGVKTSILILDKALAKKADRVAFFKVENDGFDLGAQRRAIAENDLPRVMQAVKEYLNTNMDGQDRQDKDEASCPSCPSMLQHLMAQGTALVAEKERIAANGEYSLSGERYRERKAIHTKYELVALGQVCGVRKGTAITRKEVVDGPVPVIAGGQSPSSFHNKANRTGETITVSASGAYAGFVSYFEEPIFASDCSTIQPMQENLLTKFLFHVLKAKQSEIYGLQVGMGQPHVYPRDLAAFQIPLPPLEVQREIVMEIEAYQRVIDGARTVVDNYRPQIAVNPEWPMVEISQISAQQKHSIKAGPFGSTLKKESYVPDGYKIYGQEQVIRGDAAYGDYYINEEKYLELESCKVQAGDVLISLVGTYGKTLIVPQDHEPGIINPRLMKITFDDLKITPEFFVAVFAQEAVTSQIRAMSHGGTMNILNVGILKALQVPTPPLETQQAIVAELETEQSLINANRELIERFEKKIQTAIARVWGG